MKTVVFVDELLLVNFAAAAALLLGAGLLCGRCCTGLRLCVGSAAAAASTLALLAPPWPAPLAILYKIASCCGQRRVPGLLAAFCAPDAPTGAWTLLLGDDVAEEAGV